MRTTIIALIALSTGCWKLDDTLISYDVVPLENQHVVAENLVVQTFEPSPRLECPDGEAATFYAVYDSSITTPVPVAIVFHSGAFDYVKNPAQDDYLAGTHYAADDRLSRAWAKTRVFSMLGMWGETVDPSEAHTGALITALAQQEVMVLLPANCWGDLWHNHSGGRQENDYTTERFYRDGLAFSSWMYRFATDESFATGHDVGLPLEVDTDHIALLGLGDGGRAVSELLWLLTDVTYYDDPIESVMVDSVPDDLGWYYEQPSQFADYITGLERIFDEQTDTISDFSLEAYLASESAPEPRTMVVWSSYDPVVPNGAIEGVVAAVQDRADADPSAAAVEEIGASAHVFSNKDMPLAYDVVQFLFD
jgi:hypothetical protein